MQNNDTAQLSREEMQRMLDLTYEMEGLLQLALSRDDAPARITELLKAKLGAINAMWYGTDNQSQPQSDAPDHNQQEEQEVKVSISSEAVEEQDDNRAFESYDLDDDEVPAPVAVSVAQGDVIAPEAAPQPELKVTVEEIKAPAPAQKASAVEPKAPQPKVSGAPVFSLNDRFLYSRELFGGKVADFEAALKDVASMESYEEAEEYFCTEWRFDIEQPVVRNFLAVIGNYFS